MRRACLGGRFGKAARRLGHDRTAMVALEFALVGSAFLGLVLFVIFLGYRLYVQIALSYALGELARLLSVNRTQTLSQSETQFQSSTFCPQMASFLACSNLAISLQPVADYSALPQAPVIGGASNPFGPGQDGSLMLLQVSYQMPVFGWILPAGGGSSQSINGGVVTVSYPYENEY